MFPLLFIPNVNQIDYAFHFDQDYIQLIEEELRVSEPRLYQISLDPYLKHFSEFEDKYRDYY